MGASIAILDVGHGSSVVVREGDSAIVIDAGPGTGLLEYLDSTGIRHIRVVLISHADSDHLKGLVGLLAQIDITIESVYLNSDAAKSTKQWEAIVYALEDRDRNGSCEFSVELTEGMHFELSVDTRVDILAPRKALAATGPGSTDREGRRLTTNTVSAVTRVSIPGHSLIVAGDVDEVGLAHIVETGQDLNCDTLVFPHHGGHVGPSRSEQRNSEFAADLLERARPKSVIFSIGRGRFNNPRPEIVAVFAASPAHVWCTQMSTSCCASEGLDDGHLSSAFAAGRRTGRCCAGTVTISSRGFEPDPSKHDEFVAAAAPRGLCRSSSEP